MGTNIFVKLFGVYFLKVYLCTYVVNESKYLSNMLVIEEFIKHL